MTAEDVEDNGYAGEEPELIGPQRWHWAFFPAIIFHFWHNIFKCFSGICVEFSEAFHGHALYKLQANTEKKTVKNFREQLADL